MPRRLAPRLLRRSRTRCSRPNLPRAPHPATLALAYEEFNDMKCSRYQQNYQEAPPSYFYFDCVGFTGYTLERADPELGRLFGEWSSFRPDRSRQRRSSSSTS